MSLNLNVSDILQSQISGSCSSFPFCLCGCCTDRVLLLFFLHICAHLCMFVITFCSVCILFPVSMTGEHFMFAPGCSFGLSSKDWFVMQPNLSRSSFMTLWVCETSRAILPTVAESLSHPQTCLWVCACMHLSKPIVHLLYVFHWILRNFPSHQKQFQLAQRVLIYSKCVYVCVYVCIWGGLCVCLQAAAMLQTVSEARLCVLFACTAFLLRQ